MTTSYPNGRDSCSKQQAYVNIANRPGNNSVVPTYSTPPTRSPRSYVYNTSYSRRGICLVIFVDVFDPSLALPVREGCDVDIRRICHAFTNLDFEVHLLSNPTVARLISVINKTAASTLHEDADCFACVVLSHGDVGDVIYARDGFVSVNELLTPFRGDLCAGLRGKPKLFFFQACRGSKRDTGTLVTDSLTVTHVQPSSNNYPCVRRIPVEADFLMAYAAQPGYLAFRNSVSGSWFIQALTSIIFQYGRALDLLTLLTRVNYDVAYKFESNAENPSYSGMKQMPSVVSTLTKLVIFPKKQTPATVNDSTNIGQTVYV